MSGGDRSGHLFRFGGPWLQIHNVNVLIYLYRASQKLLHMASPRPAFCSFFRKYDFLKKLFNMKIFSIKFVTKRVILIFGVRWLLLKNAHVSPKCLKSMCNNFWPPSRQKVPLGRSWRGRCYFLKIRSKYPIFRFSLILIEKRMNFYNVTFTATVI